MVARSRSEHADQTRRSRLTRGAREHESALFSCGGYVLLPFNNTRNQVSVPISLCDEETYFERNDADGKRCHTQVEQDNVVSLPAAKRKNPAGMRIAAAQMPVRARKASVPLSCAASARI